MLSPNMIMAITYNALINNPRFSALCFLSGKLLIYAPIIGPPIVLNPNIIKKYIQTVFKLSLVKLISFATINELINIPDKA